MFPMRVPAPVLTLDPRHVLPIRTEGQHVQGHSNQAYFTYSATVEERLMTTSFPPEYASYKAHTKMLIPFVL